MGNFYEILGIERSADTREIKKAYNKLVRLYPPDKEPEKFRVLREAYDVLSNPATKAEYDTQFTGKDIDVEFLWDVVKKTLDDGDYKLAKDLYIQILEKQPNLPDALDGYGFACFKLEQYEEATEIYSKLLKLVQDNSDYYRNFAFIYMASDDVENAEKMMAEAYRINPVDEENFELFCELYVSRNRFDNFVELVSSHYDTLDKEESNRRFSYIDRLQKYSEMLRERYKDMSIKTIKTFVDEMIKQVDVIGEVIGDEKNKNTVILAEKLLQIAELAGQEKEVQAAELFIEEAKRADRYNLIEKERYVYVLAIKEMAFLQLKNIPEVLIVPAYESLNASNLEAREHEKVWMDAIYDLNDYYFKNREAFDRDVKFILAECPNIEILTKNLYQIFGQYLENSGTVLTAIDKASSDNRIVKPLLDLVMCEMCGRVIVIDQDAFKWKSQQSEKAVLAVEIDDLEKSLKVIRNEYIDIFNYAKDTLEKLEAHIADALRKHGDFARTRSHRTDPNINNQSNFEYNQNSGQESYVHQNNTQGYSSSNQQSTNTDSSDYGSRYRQWEANEGSQYCAQEEQAQRRAGRTRTLIGGVNVVIFGLRIFVIIALVIQLIRMFT